MGSIIVTVQGAGGINLGVSRTVSGTFQTAAGVALSSGAALTLNGIAQINAGGYFSNAPTYGSSSTLIYNSTHTSSVPYGRNVEWSATSGAGYPNNVTLSNNTFLNLGANGGTGTSKQCAGNLTINTGSGLYMDFGANDMTQPLIVQGNVVQSGALSLSDVTGGDIKIRGNYTRTGVFSPKGRAVFFDAPSADQTITGATIFDYCTIDKTAGNVILTDDITCNQTLDLKNGKISTGAYKVISTAAVDRTNGYVIGHLQKSIPTGATTRTFEIGDAANYTPLSINFGNVTTAGNITASVATGVHPNSGAFAATLSTSKYINRYWVVTNSGTAFDNYSATFTFVSGDIQGSASTSALKVGKSDASTWSYPTVSSNTATTATATGMTSFSDFVLAECTNPTAFNVTGTGSYCTGGSGLAIGLSGSEIGVNYQLKDGTTSIGSPVAGTGNALSFGLQTTATTYTVLATNAANCTATMNGNAIVSIDPVSVGGTIAGSATVCSGTNSTPLTLSGNTGSVIKWQSSTDNFATMPTDVSNMTNTLTATNLTATTYYRAVVQSGVCVATNSSNGVVTVNPTLTASISGAATICNGTTTTITFTGSPNTVVTYKIDAGSDLTTTLNGAGTSTVTTAALVTTTTTYTLVSVAYAASPSCIQTIIGQSATITFTQCTQRLAAKVFIQGAYKVSTGFMNDGLRINSQIPTTQPYTTLTFAGATAYLGIETFDPSVLTTTGANAIVDWVLIELRDATTPATVVQRRAALLQSDGDIVDVDGTSSVTFDALANGNYHIVIRHRLCLATRTQTPIAFAVYTPSSPTTSSLDFTGNSNALSGSQKLLRTGVYGLYIGDTDRGGVISQTDITNIRGRNPTIPTTFIYNLGYDLDFNASIFSTDILIARSNSTTNQVNLNQ